MSQLLPHERPRRRMESVTPRGLDVTCCFRLNQREILAVDKRQDLSSKPAAIGVEIGTQDHTATGTTQHTRAHTHNTIKKEAARTHINGETQHVAPKMNGIGDASRASRHRGRRALS